MNQHINLLAFGTFGSPNGFTQTFFAGNNDLSKGVRTFDLKTDAIRLYPNSKVYSIRKELVNETNGIAYGIYTFAKEPNSERGGTFIGSAILVINKLAEERTIINCLEEFHSTLVAKYVQNDIIAVNHSNKMSASKPRDFDKLQNQLREVEDLNFRQSSNKSLVVYTKTTIDKLQHLLKKSVDLLNVYDTIYFTESNEVAEFVKQKGVFKIVVNDAFEQELISLQELKKQKVELSISEFEKEKRRVEEDKIRLIEEYTKQIEKNEKIHEENRRRMEESKKELKNVVVNYEIFSGKIDESIGHLKSGKKLESVRQLHQENKRLFIDSVNQQKNPELIHTVSKPTAKTNLTNPPSPKYYEEDWLVPRKIKTKNPKEKNNYGRIGVLFVCILLVIIAAFFLLLRPTSSNEDLIPNEEPIVPEVVQPAAEPKTLPAGRLMPAPNGTLNERDNLMVIKQLKMNMELREVVQIIFDANPGDVKNIYAGQEGQYAAYLMELNKDCFRLRDKTVFLIQDNLINIPSYKKELE